MDLRLFLSGDFEANSDLRVGATWSADVSGAVHYKNGSLSPIYKGEVGSTFTAINVRHNASWVVETRFEAELHFVPFKVGRFAPFSGLGAHVGIVPYLGVRSGCGDDSAETYTGWRVTVGGDLSAIGGPQTNVPAYDSSPTPRSPVLLTRFQDLVGSTTTADTACPEDPSMSPPAGNVAQSDTQIVDMLLSPLPEAEFCSETLDTVFAFRTTAECDAISGPGFRFYDSIATCDRPGADALTPCPHWLAHEDTANQLDCTIVPDHWVEVACPPFNSWEYPPCHPSNPQRDEAFCTSG